VDEGSHVYKHFEPPEEVETVPALKETEGILDKVMHAMAKPVELITTTLNPFASTP